MTVYRDLLGYMFDNSVPAFLTFTDGNVLGEDGQPKFYYHRPSRQLLDVDDIQRLRAKLNYAWKPNEVGSDDVWLYANARFGNNPNPPAPNPDDEFFAGAVTFQDVSEATAALPDWVQLVPNQTAGIIVIDGTDPNAIRVTETANGAVELQATISHSWGSAVILGVQRDGDEITELTRMTVQSSVPVKANVRWALDLSADRTYTFWISSNFEFAPFSALGANFLIVQS